MLAVSFFVFVFISIGHTRLASACYSLGRWQECIDAAGQALQLDETNASAASFQAKAQRALEVGEKLEEKAKRVMMMILMMMMIMLLSVAIAVFVVVVVVVVYFVHNVSSPRPHCSIVFLVVFSTSY